MSFWQKMFGGFRPTSKRPVAVLPASAQAPTVSTLPAQRHPLEDMLQTLGTKAWTSHRASSLAASGFLFSPAGLSPRDASSINSAVKLLYEHARRWAPGLDIPYRVPLIKLQLNLRAAGQFHVDAEGWVTIYIAPRYLEHPNAVWLILAHEVCHHILNQSGINVQNDTERNERLTDVAMFVCGFGDIARNGFKLITRNGDEYTQTHLGYLQSSEYAHAYRWVISARKRNELPGMRDTPSADHALASGFVISSASALAEKAFRQRVPEDAHRERLIAYQRSKHPHSSRAELISHAMEALERDNR